jgi:hypothetical protein
VCPDAEGNSTLNPKNAGTESPPNGEPSTSNEAKATDPAAQTTPSAPDLSSLSTEDLVNHPAVRKLLDDQAAGLRSTFGRKLEKAKAKVSPPAPPPTTDEHGDPSEPPAWVKSLVQKIETLEARAEADTFDSAFRASGIPAEFKADALDLAKQRKPDDLGQFLADFAKKYVRAEPGKGEAPRPASPTPGSTPTAQRDFEGVIDPATLSREDIARLRSEGRFVPLLERWRKNGLPQKSVFGRGRQPQK